MASAFVMLIAGAGRRTSRRSVRYHRQFAQATRKGRPRIAYIGAASGDSPAFRRMIGAMVFGARADVLSVDLTHKVERTSAIRGALAGADMIFLSGGDVERGMRAFAERDLPPYVRELAAQGKPMEGLSAGAILLGAHWVRFVGEDESIAQPFPCLGVVPASFDTHGEGDGWDELRGLAGALATEAGEQVVYGIPSGGAACWQDGKLQAMGEPLVRFRCGPRPKRISDVPPVRRASGATPAKWM